MDQTEESQLEAAIRASLEQLQPASNALTFSSDEEMGGVSDSEFFLIGSDGSEMDAEEVDHGPMNAVGSRESGRDEQTSESTTANLVGRVTWKGEQRSNASGQTSKSNTDSKQRSPAVGVHPLNSTAMARGRKRYSTGSEDDLPRKALRVYSPTEELAPHSNHLTSRQGAGKEPASVAAAPKGRTGGRKGKGKAKETKSLSVEEQLESGAIRKEDVAHVLIRLPEGERVQKAFLRLHPVQVCGCGVSLDKGKVVLHQHTIPSSLPRNSMTSSMLKEWISPSTR